MNPSLLFSGRAYSFGSDVEIPKEEASYRFVEEVISKSSVDIEIDSISEIECNENFDTYKVCSNGLLYCVKISLDKDCVHIKNEIEFYKDNNDSGIIPHHLDSGTIRIGSDLIFLILSHDNGHNIKDEGNLSIIENSDSFFYTMHHFSNLKTKSSLEDYILLYLRDTKIKDSSEVLSQNISSNYDIDSIQKIFDALRDEAFCLSKDFNIENNKCCHGVYNTDSIVTKEGLYKLKNFNYTFSGSMFFDLSFFCVSSGLTKTNCLVLFEKYCSYHDLNLIKNKSKFDNCIKISSCLFFSRILFDYLIEETIFETRRPERLFSLCLDFSKSFHNINNLKCKDFVSDPLKNIITRPVLDS